MIVDLFGSKLDAKVSEHYYEEIDEEETSQNDLLSEYLRMLFLDSFLFLHLLLLVIFLVEVSLIPQLLDILDYLLLTGNNLVKDNLSLLHLKIDENILNPEDRFQRSLNFCHTGVAAHAIYHDSQEFLLLQLFGFIA